MNIIDLNEATEELYFVCLEDWSADMAEAGDHKKCWYAKMKDNGLRVKLAVGEQGEIGGMIQCLPIEHSMVDGANLTFIQCIWVHGHKQGRGDFQRRGMGKALLQAAESDAKSLNAKGMVAWGVSLPFFMRASWFKKQGYRVADRQGIQVLLWKPFTPDSTPPHWIKPKKKPELTPGKVTVTGFINGWCPAQNMVFERAKRAAAEFGDCVEFRAIDTSNREIFLEWGISDALFVDRKEIGHGPPLSYDKILHHIAQRVKKLKRRGYCGA